MRTGPTTLPDNGPRKRRAPLRWVPRLRDARIRSKLALILVVPLAAVAALATVRLVDVGQGALEARLVSSLAALSTDVSALAQDVHKERMAALTLLASDDAAAESYNARVRRTDESIAAYAAERAAVGEVPTAVERQLIDIDDHLGTLNATRQEVLDRRQMPVPEAVLRYGVILSDLASYGEILGQVSGEGEVPDSLRAVSAFARAKAATAEEEAIVFAALSAGQLDEEQFSSYLATLTSQQEALLSFSLTASPWEQDLVNTSVTGDAVFLADRVATEITRSVGQRATLGPDEAARAVGAVNDLMRWAEIQLESQLLDRASQVSTDVTRQAMTESALVLIALVLAIALAVVLARSLNSSLRRLREGAMAVANRDLPEAVAKLRDINDLNDRGPEEIVRNLRDPIRLPNRDEVGQVGQAFNVVHREAVRIAAEQAALRASVSAMFLSLARRSQTLVDRMIGELDMIERGEEDPKRLAQLFQLDHLATRMRRNDENLLVLAGADSSAPRREDALLVDALRAAQSEVELYNRIEFGTVDTDILISAHAVNDVVRLVAELLDNATRFSPPTTTVVADARRLRDYVLIQVEDRGLGLSEEQFDNLNRRLAAPSTMDVSAFRLMGLAVVSRLAGRYGIRVELRPNVEGGTVAQVTLPSSILVLPQRSREPVMSRGRLSSAEPVSAAPTSGGSWSPVSAPPTSPALPGRTATLTDQWQNARSSQWNAVAGANTAAFSVTAGAAGPLSNAPTSGALSNAPTSGALFNAPTSGPAAGSISPRTAGPVPGPMAGPAPPVMSPAMLASPAPAPAPPAPPAPTAPAAAGPDLAASVGTPTVAYPTVRPSTLRGYADQGVIPATAHPMSPVVRPAAQLPQGPVAGATGVGARPDEPAEMPPIFREMEAVWFRAHGQAETSTFQRPAGGYGPNTGGAANGVPLSGDSAATLGAPSATAPTRPPLPARNPGQSAPPPAAYSAPVQPNAAPHSAAAPADVPSTPAPSSLGAAGAIPRQRTGGTDTWRTAADEGWARASQAAEPEVAGTTRSGLPKRRPQAQLVPGGVESKPSRSTARRTPDEVRGLLSAYHRGVQRGRTVGTEQYGATSTKETSE
ncbi:nitrate- and nitrite sensing domain-containing protein [Solwaraspora sp. WMMD406]|uniref:nitrate- and nitrite sensing domain-containing protein n=1 Tax=Solwaraspora sp. WMMD406 TaxID=3016095 RepID=UPI002417951C|nr:nitrate- and nitrite sensing domain-containing protein [Solwaraspora sp. WMMD406]MDG4763715.1 nitrate- and nitrite sensing domain-containing protein [Solwaraspora sp. WMMD406]